MHAVRNLEASIAVTQNYVDLTNVLAVPDGMRGMRPPAPAALLGKLVRAGRDAWISRGDTAAWGMMRPHLIDGVMARRRSATVHAHALDAAVRELSRDA